MKMKTIDLKMKVRQLNHKNIAITCGAREDWSCRVKTKI